MSNENRSQVAERILPLIDLTDLAEDASDASTDDLCRRAVQPEGRVAAVCLWPQFVGRAVEALADSRVRVATVVNFPAGEDDPRDVVAATHAALAGGADEIDVVMPYRAFVRGELGTVIAMMEAVRAAVPRTEGQLLKVIIETGALPTGDAVTAAAALVIGHGADFVKTSTGKIARNADLASAAAILAVIRNTDRQVGIKPSGGIRTVEHASAYLLQADEMMGSSWATPATFRFGASALLDDVLAHLRVGG